MPTLTDWAAAEEAAAANKLQASPMILRRIPYCLMSNTSVARTSLPKLSQAWPRPR